MPKRSNAGEAVQLALELLKRIPRTHSVTARELHQQLPAGLARDLRTVQRQLEMLSSQFDIERDESSKPYGYPWKSHSVGLALPTLTDQESLLLALAEEQLSALLPASLMKAMGGFFAQARRRLDPLNGSQRNREWLGKVRVVSDTQRLLPPKIVAGVFEAVSNSLYENRGLSIDYRNAAGKQSTATVMPLGLAQQGPRLYLVCRFEGFENERSLALHRISHAEMSATSFKRPADFDLRGYDEDGRFSFGEGERIKLCIQIDKVTGQHLLESPLSADQEVRELTDALEITATVVDSARLRWWLRGFGDAVEVLAPPALVTELED